MRNKVDFSLYLITDRKLVTRNSRKGMWSQRDFMSSLVTAVRQTLSGGVRAVQLREKDLSTRELLRLAYKMRDLTNKYSARLFINNRFDIALAVGADGVHLAQDSIPAEAVRKAVKKKLLIGVSAHSLKEAKSAQKAGADFITLGPIYRTPSKLKYGSPLGINTLKKVSRGIRVPVFAIGGIKGRKIKELKKAGTYGVAVISEIFKASDIQKKTKELINILGSR
ncbi:MAG: thiamine phosphate synthase [Candidatus Mariimomonas ferrooxydans]